MPIYVPLYPHCICQENLHPCYKTLKKSNKRKTYFLLVVDFGFILLHIWQTPQTHLSKLKDSWNNVDNKALKSILESPILLDNFIWDAQDANQNHIQLEAVFAFFSLCLPTWTYHPYGPFILLTIRHFNKMFRHPLRGASILNMWPMRLDPGH